VEFNALYGLPNDDPQGWEHVRVLNVCSVRSGQRTRSYRSTQCPLQAAGSTERETKATVSLAPKGRPSGCYLQGNSELLWILNVKIRF